MTGKTFFARPGYGWYVSAVCAFTAAISAATGGQFSATLAPLAARLGTTEDAVALTDPLKSVVVVFAMLGAPALTKKYGWRTTFVLAFLAFLLPQVLIPRVASLGALAGLKAAQGFSALLFPLALTLIMEWSPPSGVGFATSIFMGVFYAGGAMGGAVAGFVSGLWGWKASYDVLSVGMAAMALVFFTTLSSKKRPEERSEDRGAYGFVLRHRLTWLLVVAFLPSVWTVQAIWSDMVPFGLGLGYTDAQTGAVMSLSAAAILAGSLASGKISDRCAARFTDSLRARVGVFAVGMILIALGIGVTVLLKPAPPRLAVFNLVVLLLSFGAAWGLGSFYCIFTEIYTSDQVAAANGLIGGIADMAMPISPVLMAVWGIRMNLWDLAWLSCAAVAAVGLVASWRIFATTGRAS